MGTTTDIEKKSLEAHVDLCAQRYKFLEEKLETMEETMTAMVTSITAVKATMDTMAQKNNDRLINWGIGIIVFLLGIVGWLLSHFVLK